MVSAIVKSTFYRILLPASLLLAGFLRPSFISFCYVFLALLASIFPPISAKSARLTGSTKAYLVITFLTSILALLAQLVYQITDHVVEKDEVSYKTNCEHFRLEYWLIQFGLIRLPTIADDVGWNFGRIIAPEIISTCASLVTLIICLTSSGQNSNTSSTRNLTDNEQIPEVVVSNSHPENNFFSSLTETTKRITDVLTVFFIIFIGILNPSILNIMHFIGGMAIITWWSLYSPLKRNAFNQIKVFLIFYSAFHFLLLFAYQIPSIQYYLEPTSFTARLVGLTPLVTTSCGEYWSMGLAPAVWTQYTNFFLILAFYEILILQYKWTRFGIRQVHDAESSVHEEGPKERNNMEMHSLPTDRPNGSQVQTDAQNNTLLANDNEDGHNSFPLQRLTSQVIDRQKISFIFRGSNAHQQSSFFTDAIQQFCYFTLYHSYVFALIAMLVWAMLYHSVFGLFFLITPCVVFALYESRKLSFKLSPILVIYAEFLLLAQYVYSMNLKVDELPNGNYMKIIGFVRAETRTAALTTLAIKIVLSLPLFALLRLHLREDYYDSLTGHDIRRLNYGTFDSPRNENSPIVNPFNVTNKNFFFLKNCLCSSWIFVVVLVLLFNSIVEPPVLYAVGYFLLWTALICNLIISFPAFRRAIFVILTILIIYSSVVLTSLYCYQFPSIPFYWKSLTHLSDDWNRDIGLVNFKDDDLESSLFARLSKPILLLIVTMVQLKFFHRSWSQLVETPSTRSRRSSLTRHENRSVDLTVSKLRCLAKSTYEVLWRVAEIHLHRFVLFVIMLVATNHYCALNFVAVLLVVIALCLPSCNRIILLITCGYLSMVFVARRLFVMHFIQRYFPLAPSTCNTTELGINKTETIFEWVGFSNDTTLKGDLIGIIFTLSLIGLQFAIQYRQKHRRRRYGLPDPLPGIIFTEAVKFELFDKSLVMGFKVLCNYCFYKFGLELSMICMVYVAWQRMDFIASILICWVLILSLSRRAICRILWPFLLIYLAIQLPLQYAMVLGLPTSLCLQYPWADLLDNPAKDDNLLSFLDLANYRMDKDHFHDSLLADFFLLMVVAAQWVVFKVESKTHPAGSNNSIYADGEFTLRKENPHPDFIAKQDSFVDYIKIAVFMYGHWFTMIMVLSAGLGGTSLFALGYLILAFWMLWQGNNLYTMRNYKRTLSRWYILCAYTVTAMLWKISLQIIGCVFARDMDEWSDNLGCILRQLFSIVCVDEPSVKRLYGSHIDVCEVEIRETKIGLDLLAFAVIIFQLRILHSYLFQHCIVDVRCEIIQSSRGAILINQLVEKQMLEQNETQTKLFDDIKQRMQSIRQRYEKQFESRNQYFVPETYAQGRGSLGSITYTTLINDPRRFSYVDEDDPFPFYDPQQYENIGSVYHRAKRAGDYYMFDYDPHAEEDITHPEEQYVEEVTPGAGEYNKLDPTQLLHTAITKDMDLKRTLNSAKSAEKIKDEEKRMIEAVRHKIIEPKHSPKQPHSKDEKSTKEMNKEAVDLLIEVGERAKESDVDYATEQVLKEKDLAVEDEADGSSSNGGPEITVHKLEGEEEESDEKSRSEDEDEAEDDKSMVDCVFSCVRFVWKLLTAALHYLSAFFDRHSREHRFVAFVLDQEKRHLKGHSNTLYAIGYTTDELRSEWKSHGMKVVNSSQDIAKIEECAKTHWEQRNVITKFIISYINFLAAYSHILCFVCACIAHSACGGLITLPLPLMVFFWGTLCNPRPPKLFWITMISYTELIILVKFVFQFGFYPWNKKSEVVKNSPNVFKTQYLLGVQKVDYFALYEVILLIVLFLHRYMLRRIGLWKDANTSDTFNEPNIADSSKRASVVSGKLIPVEDPNVIEQRPGTSKEIEVLDESVEDPNRTGFSMFYHNLRHPKFRYIRDLYPIMFFLDVFCMIILVFKYSQFGELSSASNVLLSSRIPIMFVVMIFILIVMIVIDRALYLRKSVFWKLIYQLFSISILHIWIFGALPAITKTEAAENKAAAWFYVFKCLYLIVSAWQIRNGYPKLCVGNLLTHSYGMINYVLFYVFMFLPLVFELRTIIDWTWTETTMPIFDFIKMEVFYSKIYLVKCARVMEMNFPAPRGEPRGKLIKLMYGLPAIFAVILLVLSPLLAFSLLNRIGAQNRPQRVDLTIALEGYPPIYAMSAQGIDLDTMSTGEVQRLTNWFSQPIDINKKDQDHARTAISFINDYTTSGIPDIIKIKFRPESDVFWSISSESLDAMQQELHKSSEANVTLILKIHLEFVRGRPEDSKEPVLHSTDYFIDIAPRSKLSTTLQEAIKNPGSRFDVENALPYYVVVPNEGKVQDAEILFRTIFPSNMTYEKNETYSNLNFDLGIVNPGNKPLWNIQFTKNQRLEGRTFPYEKIDYGHLNGTRNYVQMVAFVDRLFPSFITKYTQGGVSAMYLAIVFVAARIIRSVVTSEPLDVIITEMPNPDYLLKICSDIYLVREARDFILEEDLFAKLIFLFRSPATLIKWTRYKIKND